MKIAIFSDSHDNLPNIEKFLQWVNANQVEQLIFCGDLCAPATLKKMIAPKFSGLIHMVFGNVTDRELMSKVATSFSQVRHYGDVGEFVIDGLHFAITHYPNQAKELGVSEKYNFVFYGHNHTPWEEKIGSTIVANPGTLAGLFQKATFAVLDTQNKKLELKILERL
jgi:putative phosphoesterase